MQRYTCHGCKALKVELEQRDRLRSKDDELVEDNVETEKKKGDAKERTSEKIGEKNETTKNKRKSKRENERETERTKSDRRKVVAKEKEGQDGEEKIRENEGVREKENQRSFSFLERDVARADCTRARSVAILGVPPSPP